MNERRRKPRCSPATDLVAQVNSAVDGLVIDISPLGVQLETSGALRPASRCFVSLPSACGTLRLRAEVQRCRATARSELGDTTRLVFRSGLRFLDVSELENELLCTAFVPAHARAVIIAAGL